MILARFSRGLILGSALTLGVRLPLGSAAFGDLQMGVEQRH